MSCGSGVVCECVSSGVNGRIDGISSSSACVIDTCGWNTCRSDVGRPGSVVVGLVEVV